MRHTEVAIPEATLTTTTLHCLQRVIGKWRRVEKVPRAISEVKSTRLDVLNKGPERPVKRDFPGGPVAKTPCVQCRGRGFDPWWGN